MGKSLLCLIDYNLALLDSELAGTHHRGVDDAYKVARIL
jgi:inhibitor of KinA sporulation pathway (predicted exonuclease)